MKILSARPLTGAFLKNTAIILMVVNHGLYAFAANTENIIPGWLNNFQLYATRAGFLLFAFLIAEGLRHTSDKRKYILRMVVMAFVSEFFFDATLMGRVPYWIGQNIFFTWTFAAILIFGLEYFKGRRGAQTILCVAVFAAELLSFSDWSVFGLLAVLLFYYLNDRKILCFGLITISVFVLWFAYQVIFALATSVAPDWLYCLKNTILEAHCILAFPLIYLYNGERGRQLPKAFYYAFYPGHLAIIGAAVAILTGRLPFMWGW